MRPIDADRLIVAIKRKAPISDAMRVMWAECLEEVYHMPTIEPKRKTGKWIRISPAGIYECSECHGHIMTKDIDCYDFCHRCGVAMTEEDRE